MDEQRVKVFIGTLGDARFSRYLKAANGDQLLAFELYTWNCQLSEAFYVVLQTWEVTLRNRLNGFLCSRYGSDWPLDEKRAVRQLANPERKRLGDAVNRQRRRRKTDRPSTDSIVADLSAGFWVSLLGTGYEIPFVWRKNLDCLFPNGADFTRELVSQKCGSILDLRNRIAHHEPIYHLPLSDIRSDADLLLRAMCPGAHGFSDSLCRLRAVLTSKPQI